MTDELIALQRTLFFSIAALLLALEQVPQLQRQSTRITGRWTTNIGLMVVASAIASLAIPMGAYEYAHMHAQAPLARLGIPRAAEVLVTFLFLDLWRYWEHRLLHQIPLLWRVHLVHHSDTHLDVTTSERHHPFESILSTATLLALILYCGLPAVGVGVYLIVATAASLYSHANLRCSQSTDMALEWVFVTPRFHAVHHSNVAAETDSNYGSVLTIWDRVFRTYLDPSKAKLPNFGLEYFHRAQDTSFARALQQPFMYRIGMSYPSRCYDSESRPAQLMISRAWKSALLGGFAGCVLAGLALWPTAADMAAIWVNNQAYQYAWLVLPMGIYVLAAERRNDMLAMALRPGFTGVLLATIASALWIIAALANIDIGRHIALVLVVQGILMAMIGWQAYWRLFPILGLLFLTIPSTDLLLPFLRILTLKSIEFFASLLQLPYSLDGFLVHIGTNRYIVAQECAGLPYVTLAVFLTYSFALLIYRSFLKILSLTLLGAALAFFSNAVRVNSIVLVDWLRGSQMELSVHAGFQWIGLIITLGLLFVALSRAKADTPNPALALVSSARRHSPVQALAPVVAGLAALSLVGGFSLANRDRPRETRAVSTPIAPLHLAGWKLVSAEAEWAIDPGKAYSSIAFAYQRNPVNMQVRVIRTLDPNAKLPEPRVGSEKEETWRNVDTEKQTLCVYSRCVPLLHSKWRADRSSDVRHVFYRFTIGDFATNSQLALRMWHGWYKFKGYSNSPGLIALVFDKAPPSDQIAVLFLALSAALESTETAGPPTEPEAWPS